MKMTGLLQDVRYALRQLRKSPGFAAVAVVTLALGIGANTAIFSVVHAVLLRPLGFRDASRLVRVWHVPPAKSFPGMTTFAVSAANYLDWERQNHVFDQMAIYACRGFDLTGNDKPESVRGEHHYAVIARLKPGVELNQAQAEMKTISARLEQLYPEDDKGWGSVVVPLHDDMVADVRPALLVLLGAVAFVLLIACVNVANLALAKTFSRQKEIAIRTALGATSARVLRQILTESVLLALAGGMLGLGCAHFGIRLIVAFLADKLPRSVEFGLDSQVLAFTAVISVATGIAAGVLPAWRLTRRDVNQALKQGLGRTDADSGGQRTRSILVGSEVALSLVLLVGAGLMIRSFERLQSVNPGFDSRDVLTMSAMVSRAKFPSPAQQISFFERVLQRVRALPGLESAGVIDDIPLGDGGSHQPIAIEGRPVVPMAEQPEVDVRVISTGYLGALHIPLRRGRDLSDTDVAGRPAVVVISESMARQFWPAEDALGKRLTLTFFPDAVREVVGVVGDVKLDSLDQTRPSATLYFPLDQLSVPAAGGWSSFPMTLVIRSASGPAGRVSAVSNAVHQIDREIPLRDILAMAELVANSLTQQRFNMLLLGSFAGLALLLAAVGIYSVLSYSVKRSGQEIGIRLALGARLSDVLRMVVFEGMKPTLVGVAVGTAGALALGRALSSLIYGVRPTDPLTFIAVALLLAAVALAATMVPAYRATKVDPLAALRYE
jgi:putative ABC transport system permease protein